MAENEPPSLADAIKFALSILGPFRESSLYDDYQVEDGWTDDQFQSALDVLHAAVAKDDVAGQTCFIVESAKPSPRAGAR